MREYLSTLVAENPVILVAGVMLVLVFAGLGLLHGARLLTHLALVVIRHGKQDFRELVTALRELIGELKKR